MNFDEYWHDLVGRVYDEGAELHGDEERFFRLSCIYGETMVDGIESYFERRFGEFPADMAALRESGFGDLAAEFERARGLIFGAAPLEDESVRAAVARWLGGAEDIETLWVELDKIYERIIPRMDRLADYKHAFGLSAGLFDGD